MRLADYDAETEAHGDSVELARAEIRLCFKPGPLTTVLMSMRGDTIAHETMVEAFRQEGYAIIMLLSASSTPCETALRGRPIAHVCAARASSWYEERDRLRDLYFFRSGRDGRRASKTQIAKAAKTLGLPVPA